MEYSKIIGQYVKQKYKKMGLTQEKFANKCGILPSHLRDIEQGKTKSITIEMCNLFANALEISLYTFLIEAKVIEPIFENKLSKEDSSIFCDLILNNLEKCGFEYKFENENEKTIFANSLIYKIIGMLK